MFSTSGAARWLRAGASQAQTAARRAVTSAVSTIAAQGNSSAGTGTGTSAGNTSAGNTSAGNTSAGDKSAGDFGAGSTSAGKSGASGTDGSDDPFSTSAAGEPDVSRFTPGGDQFHQPDQTTCGSSSLVMAKMINTPDYGTTILQPGDDGTVDSDAVKQRFDQAVLSMHTVTGGWKDSAGTWQLPWPAQLGTPPWAVARQMSATGGSGVTGSSYRSHLVDPLNSSGSYDAVAAAVAAGQCVPLFIGNDVMARHVVLVTGHSHPAAGDELSIYDPSCGQWVTATRAGYVGNDINIAGWGQPWFAILPA